jgi:hypothetical protein
MRNARRAIALFGILWAILAPAYLYVRTSRDELARKWAALASSALAESPQAVESFEFTAVTFVSSGFILLLSLSSLLARSTHEKEPSNGRVQ